LLADASVARNFAVLGWIDELVALAGGTLDIAHGVLGLGPDETGEIERIRVAFDSESVRSPGSPAATAALVGLDDLIRRRSHDVTVLVPTEAEIAVAVRLQDPKERAWRQSLGVRARRLMRVRRSRSGSPRQEVSHSRPTTMTDAPPTSPSADLSISGRSTSSRRPPL
jgi:hypothetical protein